MASPREYPDGHFHKKGSIHPVGDRFQVNPFFLKDAPNHGTTGFGPARPHAGPGQRFELVYVPDAVPDRLPDFTGGYPFAAANDDLVESQNLFINI